MYSPSRVHVVEPPPIRNVHSPSSSAEQLFHNIQSPFLHEDLLEPVSLPQLIQREFDNLPSHSLRRLNNHACRTSRRLTNPRHLPHDLH